jgi:hypothetical protein
MSVHCCRNRWERGCSVGAWREFIFRVQVQVLCERISWWWSYKVERAFSSEKVGMLPSTLNAYRTYGTTSYVSCKGSKSERRS